MLSYFLDPSPAYQAPIKISVLRHGTHLTQYPGQPKTPNFNKKKMKDVMML